MKVCFTGHRKLDPKNLHLIKDRTVCGILNLIEKGATDFIAGGALGFDTFVAQIILELKNQYPGIRLCLYLPCPEQDKNWNEEDKIIYKDILKRADEIRYISDRYTDTCMRERNKAMVEDASVCIAYYDGRPRSGTAMTVNYAKKKGIEVINVY